MARRFKSAVGGTAARPVRPVRGGLAAVGLLGGGELDRVEEHDAQAGHHDVVCVRALGDPPGSGRLDPLRLLER